MQLNRKNRGFTLVELMMTIFVVVIVGILFFYCTIGAGNFWCTEESVAKQLKAEHPEISDVTVINRGVWSYTKVLVKTNEGKAQTYCLDSNILFNYEFSECSK